MYEIIIKKKEIVTKTGGQDWKVIEERPYTRDELSGACEEYISRSDAEEEHFIKRIYGHTPKKEIQEEVEQVIYRQIVEEINLFQVIEAVNVHHQSL